MLILKSLQKIYLTISILSLLPLTSVLGHLWKRETKVGPSC